MPIPPPPPLKASMFGKMPVGGQKPKSGGGAPVAKPPTGVPIEHRIGIHTPPEVIWDLLYDLEGWSRWNPLFIQAAGTIRIGEALTMTLAPAGSQPRELHPVVLEWVPNDQLHLRWTEMRGLIRVVRYMEIEQLGDESCIFSNGEIVGGLVGPSVARRYGGMIYKGLRQMSEALKAEAEARWQGR